MQRKLMAWGAILAMLSVAFGAFGAHMLKNAISEEDLQVYQTGVHYHMIHALGLILISLAIGQWGESSRLKWASRLLCLGIILFSGSLYALSLSGVSILGAITPLGGVCFLAGWLCLAWEALSHGGQKA